MPKGETPRTLPELTEGLNRLLSAEGDPDIEAIHAHVRGIEGFTKVNPGCIANEAAAFRTEGQARKALKDTRLAALGIVTSQQDFALAEAVGR